MDKIDEVQTSTSLPLTKEDKIKKQYEFINHLNFTRLSKTIVQDLTNNRKESVLFKKYSKEKVIDFLSKPQEYEKQIREMSIFLYANSSQYRRLCNYFAKLATFNYTIIPYNLNKDKYNKKSFLVNYQKIANLLEKFNLKSELIKIFIICFYQDTFCGLYFETQDSFDVMPINIDYCKITSKEDGCLIYSLDFNFFNTRKYLLNSYGDNIKQMYYAYAGYQENINGKKKKIKGDVNLRWQEPPNQICIKVNEDQLLYSAPPFSAIFPDILNFEDYKMIKKTGELLDKYKLLALQIPLSDQGEFQLDEGICNKYYNDICNNVSDNIGVIQTPMKLEAISFQNTATAQNNAVQEAEEEIFSSAGSSMNLFGGKNSSSSSLNISIKNDESITYALLRQVETWVNKYIKNMNLPYGFKIQFLNQSIYNESDVCDRYQKASTYGVVGAKSLYAASLGVSPSNMIGLQELEECLDFENNWKPLKSSNTMSTDTDSGRPTNKSKGKDLTPAGEQTQDNDENDNK